MAGAIGQSIGGFLGAAHGTSEALSNLNEGRRLASSYLQNWTPTDFTSFGLNGSYSDGTFNLTRSPEMTSNLAGLSSSINTAVGDYRNLIDQVRPGFSALTESRVAANEANRRRVIGDLRQNLQRRRVLGSSFASDALTRANLQYSQEEDKIRAESFLQELQATRELTTQANQTAIDGALAFVNQGNFESGIASNMTNSLNQIFATNTQLNAQLTADLYSNRAQVWTNWQQAHLQMLQSGTSSLASTDFGSLGG